MFQTTGVLVMSPVHKVSTILDEVMHSHRQSFGAVLCRFKTHTGTWNTLVVGLSTDTNYIDNDICDFVVMYIGHVYSC